jgi:hypothetical protein
MVRSCGYCHQDLKVIPTVRKLNILDIVLQLSLWRIGIEVTISAALDAVRDMYVEGERHSAYSPLDHKELVILENGLNYQSFVISIVS